MPSRILAAPNRFLGQTILRVLVRWRVLWIILLAALMLSGCVQYDVEVNVDSPNRGEIVQHIRLDERLTAFSDTATQQWLDSLDRRARTLQGKTRRLSARELLVTIPFSSGAELEQKFNQFFAASPQSDTPSTSTSALELPAVDSRLHLTQTNLFLVQRNRLTYDLNLESLGVLAANDNLLISPASLFDLSFRLNTPWGARSIVPPPPKSDRRSSGATLPDPPSQSGKHLNWALKPGQQTHLEAVFWLPNPLGIGTVVIVLLVAAGSFLKYQRPVDADTPPTILPEG